MQFQKISPTVFLHLCGRPIDTKTTSTLVRVIIDNENEMFFLRLHGKQESNSCHYLFTAGQLFHSAITLSRRNTAKRHQTVEWFIGVGHAEIQQRLCTWLSH